MIHVNDIAEAVSDFTKVYIYIYTINTRVRNGTDRITPARHDNRVGRKTKDLSVSIKSVPLRNNFRYRSLSVRVRCNGFPPRDYITILNTEFYTNNDGKICIRFDRSKEINFTKSF